MDTARSASPVIPSRAPASSPAVSSGLVGVLRYLYIESATPGRPRNALSDRVYRGSRAALQSAAAAGLVRRAVRADRQVFWGLTDAGRRALGI